MLRVRGNIERIDAPALDRETVHRLVYALMSDEHRAAFDERHELDFALDYGHLGRFRVNAYLQRTGPAAALRLIPRDVPSLAKLELPPIIQQMCELESGLVLVTGPTGSGKSTTLAAMIDSLNATFPGHILTIEDPIEFLHPSKRAHVSQRELGPHTHSFANALRSALREDPDVILVGEMRDLETIRLAITAAETGHLVFATLHSPSAPQTIDRIIDVFPPEQQAQIRTQLAESLGGIVTQLLVPRVGSARVAALEILVATPAVRNLVREGKSHQLVSSMQVGQREGMQTMTMALTDLVRRGVVARDVAISRDPAVADALAHGAVAKGH